MLLWWKLPNRCSDNRLQDGGLPLKVTETEAGFMRLRFEKITGNSKLLSKRKETGCVWYLFSFPGKYCIIHWCYRFYSHCNLRPLYGWCQCNYGGGVYFSVPADKAYIADTCDVLLRGGLSCCSLPPFKG